MVSDGGILAGRAVAEEFEVILAGDPRWLRLVRGVVQEFLAQTGFDAQQREEITVAVGEAVANVIRHACKGDARQKFCLLCSEGNGAVEIELRDQGEPFDAPKEPASPPDETRAGGRGIFMMQAIMDEVKYTRQGDTNSVRMKKYLPDKND